MSWRTFVNTSLGVLLGLVLGVSINVVDQGLNADTQAKETNQLAAQVALIEGKLNYFPKIQTGP